MARIRVDPDEVVAFAGDLQGVSIRIAEETRSVVAAFEDLRDEWRDARYERFARLFEENVAILRRFCDDADEYVDFLREKARLADEYLHG